LSMKSERNEKVEFLLTKAGKYATERAMPGKLKSLNSGSALADDMLNGQKSSAILSCSALIHIYTLDLGP
jgi:hypothetical protein